MDAREPCLLKLAGPAAGPVPQSWRKRLATLIDRECLIRVPNVGIEADLVVAVLSPVQELAQEPRRPQSAHGVPHADERDRRARSSASHVMKSTLPGMRPRTLAAFIASVDIRQVIVVVCFNESYQIHEAGQRAHRKRATTEAKEKQLIALEKVVHDGPIEIAHVRLNSTAEGSTSNAVESPASP